MTNTNNTTRRARNNVATQRDAHVETHFDAMYDDASRDNDAFDNARRDEIARVFALGINNASTNATTEMRAIPSNVKLTKTQRAILRRYVAKLNVNDTIAIAHTHRDRWANTMIPNDVFERVMRAS